MFRIIVDYTKSLAEMIHSGNYGFVDPDINDQRFPFCEGGRVKLKIELINYGRIMKLHEVIQDLDSCVMRPATLPKLLAFGATYPDKQREFPIVALGSVWRPWQGNNYVVCLDYRDRVRGLALYLWGGKWDGRYRFAAVRK